MANNYPKPYSVNDIVGNDREPMTMWLLCPKSHS